MGKRLINVTPSQGQIECCVCGNTQKKQKKYYIIVVTLCVMDYFMIFYHGTPYNGYKNTKSWTTYHAKRINVIMSMIMAPCVTDILWIQLGGIPWQGYKNTKLWTTYHVKVITCSNMVRHGECIHILCSTLYNKVVRSKRLIDVTPCQA